MRRRTFLALTGILFLALVTPALTAPTVQADEDPGSTAPAAKKPNPRVLVKTSMGDVTVELFADAAPDTVRTFLGLAEGKGTFADVRSKKEVTLAKPFYDGLIFHRVIPGFMIQGGCPQGTGMGNPGFMFADEMDAEALGLHKLKVMSDKGPHPWVGVRTRMDFQQKILMPVIRKLKIDPAKLNASKELQADLEKKIRAMSLKELYEAQGYQYTSGLPSRKPVKGSLALANAGPNTNGSQFFLNLGDTPHLTGRHTVFGQVVAGMDVVEKIGAVKTNNTRPVTPVKILSIRRLP